MEALWGAAVVALLLTAALCIGCHRHRRPGASVDTDGEKATSAQPPHSFQLLHCPPYAPHSVPPQPRGPTAETPNPNPNVHRSWATRERGPMGSPQPSQQRRVSQNCAVTEMRVSPHPQDSEDDYSNDVYASGYVKVIPDPQDAAQCGCDPTGDSGSTAAPTEPYENVPDVSRRSLDDSLEYINVPTAASGPTAPYGSDRDSDADGPDYENVYGSAP